MDLMKSPKMLSYYVCTMSHKSHKWLNYDKTSANFRNRMKWMYGLCNLTSTPFDKIDCEETYSYWNWKIKSNMNTCNLTSRIWHIGLWIKRSQNPWLCFLFFFCQSLLNAKTVVNSRVMFLKRKESIIPDLVDSKIFN